MVETSDQLERERELAREKARAERSAEEADARLSKVRERLLEVETELARAHLRASRAEAELETRKSLETELRAIYADLDAANAEIRAMRETRVWRLGSSFWRLRDRVLRRRQA